jgi:uncharacterized membrane protein
VEYVQLIPPVALAICLSAACGMRVFLPPFFIGLAAHYGYLDLADQGLAWLGNWQALTICGVACVVEACAFYIPYLDNLLDTIASPLAIIAGIALSSSLLSNYDPAIKWSAAVIAGGGAAGLMQGSTVAVRAASTGLTGGLGNFIVATLELLGSILLTLFAVLLPVLGVFVVIGFFYLTYLAIKNLKQKMFSKATT